VTMTSAVRLALSDADAVTRTAFDPCDDRIGSGAAAGSHPSGDIGPPGGDGDAALRDGVG